MKTIVLVSVMCVLPLVASAQTFLYGDGVTGILSEPTPGVHYYSDAKQNGFINEIAPGVSFYSLQGSDGHTRSGFITDLSGRRSPLFPEPSMPPYTPPMMFNGNPRQEAPPIHESWRR